MSYRSEYKLGGKLFLAILIALVVGYVWACVENKRNPMDLLKIFSSKEPEPAPAPAPAPKKDPPKGEPVPLVRKDPPKIEPAPAVKVEPALPAAPGLYSSIEMSALFGTVDDLLRRGKFYDALEQLRSRSRLKVPEGQVKMFADYEQRTTRYYQLLQETTKGITVDMPAITRIFMRGAGKLVGKVLYEDNNSVILETLTNLRPKVMKRDMEKMESLQPAYGYAEISLALKDQCKYAGLIVEGDPGKPFHYREQPGKSVSALKLFDLADFCARNGANDQVLPLFDEALRRDPGLIATVHEVKGDRMTNVFLYFLSINSASDATKALDLLKKSYADTKAYREKVATDTETREYMDLVMKRAAQPPSQPLARLDPKPATTPLPAVTPATSPESKPPTPATPVEIERTPLPAAPRTPTAVALPDGTPANVASLVARGDRHYDEAMLHLKNSDPQANPDGHNDETKKALSLFMKANEEGYFPAQELYGKGSVPQPLLDRVRETTMCSSMCRKRSVSSRK